MLQDDGIEPEMPSLEWGEYLIQYLFEIGPVKHTGMGSAPVPPPYIESWQRQLGLSLTPWEVRLLLRLSGEYAAEAAVASKPDRPAPFKESSDGVRLHAARLQRNLDKFFD